MKDYDAAFEGLWNVYPKRNGKKTKKFPAYKKWLTLDADDKQSLRASVEKHNRNQSWGKYIRDLVTYINQRGWEDVIEDPVQAATVRYRLPEAPAYQCDRWERIANRYMFRWIWATNGVPDERLAEAVGIKHAVLKEAVPALEEDLAADDSRAAQTEALYTFLSLLLTRLDKAFDRSGRELVLK